MKTLRVCLAEQIPARDSTEIDMNIIYYAYDTLVLVINGGDFTGNYAIVGELPEDPAVGVLYISYTTGKVSLISNYTMKTIAEIEDTSQLALLKKAGSMFFVHAKHRYLDKTKRYIVLPVEHGSYSLTVDEGKDLVIDEYTVVKYDEENECFEICGDGAWFGNWTHGFIGVESSSVDMNIGEQRISADVKISNSDGNMLTIQNDGLYVDGRKKADYIDFVRAVSELQAYEKHIYSLIDNIDVQIADLQDIVDRDSLNERIYNILTERFDDIQEAIDNYQDLATRIEQIRAEVIAYATQQFNDKEESLTEFIVDIANNPWKELEDTP